MSGMFFWDTVYVQFKNDIRECILPDVMITNIKILQENI